jgi:DNA-binding transcriptional ArsR family regulator
MTAPRAIVITDRAITMLANPPGLTAAPALLLWNLTRLLPATGQPLNLSELAVEFGLTRVTVTNAMKKLLTTGLVLRGPKVGKVHIYKLNPAYFHHL